MNNSADQSAGLPPTPQGAGKGAELQQKEEHLPCPKCGSTNVIRNGWRATKYGLMPRWQCKKHRHNYTGTVFIGDSFSVAVQLREEVHGWVERRWPFHSTRRMSELILQRWGVKISFVSLARWVKALNGNSTTPTGLERISHKELVRRVIHAYKWGTPRSLGTACALAGLRRQANTPYMVLKTILELGFEVPRNRRLRGQIMAGAKEKMAEIYRREGTPDSALELASKVGWRPYAYYGVLARIAAHGLGLPEPPRRLDLRACSKIEDEIVLQYFLYGTPRSASALKRAVGLWWRKAEIRRKVAELGLEQPSLWASRRQERIRKFLRLNSFGLSHYPLSEEEYILIEFCEKKGACDFDIGQEVRNLLTNLRAKGWVTLYPHGNWAPTPLGEAIYRHICTTGKPAITEPSLLLEGAPEEVRVEGDMLWLE